MPERSTAAFPKERRLRRRADFLRVQSEGRRVTSAHFVFLVAPGPDRAGPCRLGLVVTRKVGPAVERNRIRRVCRETFRRWPEFLPGGVDLVVIARAGAQALGASDVRREWGEIAGVLRKRAPRRDHP
jgi:ribonuclease P protein component